MSLTGFWRKSEEEIVDDYLPQDARITINHGSNSVHVKVGRTQVMGTGLAEIARHLAYFMGRTRDLEKEECQTPK
jgi:hypothetical protein